MEEAKKSSDCVSNFAYLLNCMTVPGRFCIFIKSGPIEFPCILYLCQSCNKSTTIRTDSEKAEYLLMFRIINVRIEHILKLIMSYSLL
jgi:hypothetical protein